MKSYHDLLSRILTNGEMHGDRTGVGTLSCFGEQWRHSFAEGFPLLTTKKMPPRWIFEELRWFLSGSTNEKDLAAAGVDIWKEWSTEKQCAKFGRPEGELGPVYGHLWRNFGGWHNEFGNLHGMGEDQVKNLLEDIENTPNSRRLIVSGWHPRDSKLVTLPPCHTLWQIKCHSFNKMSLSLYARSIDAFLGLPFNIASYAFLLCMLCRVTNRTPKDLIISFGDLHIYSNHMEQVKQQLLRKPYELPRVAFDMPKGDSSMEKLLNFRWEHVRVRDYKYHDKIEAPVAI